MLNARNHARLRLESLEARNLLTTILTNEHAHLELNFQTGRWQPFEVYDTTHAISYEPDDVLFYLAPGTKTAQPAGWSFIGAGDGNPYWRMNSTSGTGFVSMAISTDNIPSNTFDVYLPDDPRVGFPDEWIKLKMLTVSGPGHVSVWQNFQPPSEWWMSSFDNGATYENAFYIAPGGHSHVNWGFTQPGIYDVTFIASAFYRFGPSEPYSSDRVTLRFGVETTGPNPPSLGQMDLSTHEFLLAPKKQILYRGVECVTVDVTSGQIPCLETTTAAPVNEETTSRVLLPIANALVLEGPMWGDLWAHATVKL
jgi:surface-anchored protein